MSAVREAACTCMCALNDGTDCDVHVQLIDTFDELVSTSLETTGTTTTACGSHSVMKESIATLFQGLSQPLGCSLSRRGYGIPVHHPENQGVVEKARDVLTVAPRQTGMSMAGGPPVTFPVFMESASRIYVPRAFGLAAFGLPTTTHLIDLPRGQRAPRLTRFSGSLRPTQLHPVQAFMEAAADPLRRGGIVSLPCGGGKTVVALHVMSLIGRRTLIVAAKDFLLNQWKERIAEFLPEASVGYLRAQTCDVEGRDIVLVSLQSLSMKAYAPELLRDFDLCVFDECHHLGAEVFSRALPRVSTPITMGLSATLDRKDGLRRVFEWYLGPVVYEADREDRSDFLVQVLIYPCPSTPDPVSGYGKERVLYGGRTNVARMLSDVCTHRPRTDALLDALMEMVRRDTGRRVLILTDRRAHIDDITLGLVARGVDPSDVGSYVGGMKQVALKASESCGFIVGTFSMAAEGFDVAALDTLVLASPVSSVEQAVGRIGRARPERRRYQPVIIDVVDDFSVFRNQAVKRRRFYASRGYTMQMAPAFSAHGPETSSS